MADGRPTQFRRALGELGIEMIPAYSPQARGRSERAFGTLQGRLPRELERAGIRDMEGANAFLRGYWARHNARFAVRAADPEARFIPLLPEVRRKLRDILCVKEERTVGRDNCVRYRNLSLQIPPQPHRCHYIKARVSVHGYGDRTMAVFHDGRELGRYDAEGRLLEREGGAGRVA